MAKLYFRYGNMGSSKTANALMTKFNFEEKKQNVILMKPEIDDRDGDNIIKSRMGLQDFAVLIPKGDKYHDGFIREYSNNKYVDYIIVDEAQFLTKEQVDELVYCVDIGNVSVFCYGLKTDFKGYLFDGSKRLIEMADSIEEIKTMCLCGKKALMNARIINGEITKTGDQIQIGGNESYVSLCRKCWTEGKYMRKTIYTTDIINRD